MSDSTIINFKVGELITILQQFPKEMPVLVNGLKDGYDNFYHPFIVKVKHTPESYIDEGQFQENDLGFEALIIEREVRYE